MSETAIRAAKTGSSSASDTLKVLLVTESGYPYRVSGVSTWCQNLLTGLANVEFEVLALVGEPDATPIYPTPKNLDAVIPLPLWGTREALEQRAELGLRDLWRARRPEHDVIGQRLVPELRALVTSLLRDDSDPVQLAAHIGALHQFFLTTDFDSSMRTEAVWEAFLSVAGDEYPAAARRAGYEEAQARLALSDVVTGLHWLYHWLLPIAQPLPRVDVVHVTMAGACTLPAVAMKLEQGCGFVFSEHGIYVRETYLLGAADRGSLFLKFLRIGFARRMSEVSYALADEITSCCEYNTRWTARSGAPRERVSVVYYGLEPSAFAPSERTGESRPVVLWMGRIDPVKDLETLLRAAAIVHAARADVLFRLHGSVPPGQEAYLEGVLALRHELDLDDTVEIPGYTSDPQHAYDGADVVVLSSISEGFPYATLEAMLSAKPVVATTVGGLSEQLADCGVLVEPKDPPAMAHALLGLLDDPERAGRLGRAARTRVQEVFDLDSKNRRYLELYRAAATSGTHAQKRDALVANAPHASTSVPDSPGLTALVDQVWAAVPHPVDEMEIAAVIEAGGMNDELARRLGAADVFAVGREILMRLRSKGQPDEPLSPHQIALPRRASQPISDLVRGVLILLPAVAVLLASHYLREIPGWTPDTGRALLLGLTTATMLANGFLYGVVRRASLLIGCDRWDASRRFLRRSAVSVALGLFLLEAVGILLAHAAGVHGAVLTTFALCFSALAVFWIACAGLMFLDQTYEAGVAVLIGLAISILTDQVIAASSPRHLEIAILVGYVVTIAAVTLRSVTAWPRPGVRTGYRRPSSAYVVSESLPYVGYGSLLIALMLGPIVLTAFLGTSASISAADPTSIEVGTTLALVPIMVSLYAAGAGISRFWSDATQALSDTAASDADAFVDRLRSSHRSTRTRYLLGLLVISLVSIPVLWALADTGSLHVFGVHSTTLVTWAFVVSLCGYALLAGGQFEAAVPFTFARPRLAFDSLAAGALAAAVVAVVLFAFGELEVGFVSLLVGSAVFAVLAGIRNRRFFRDLLFHYVRSL